jgi:hypothetical protein
MGEFYLEKYPVMSANGNEYLVSVFQDHYAYKHVNAQVYIKRKGLFGREKFVCVSGGNMFDRSIYLETEWNYDYKAIALNEVKKYENTLESQRLHELNRKEGAKRFEDWDGRATE